MLSIELTDHVLNQSCYLINTFSYHMAGQNHRESLMWLAPSLGSLIDPYGTCVVVGPRLGLVQGLLTSLNYSRRSPYGNRHHKQITNCNNIILIPKSLSPLTKNWSSRSIPRANPLVNWQRAVCQVRDSTLPGCQYLGMSGLRLYNTPLGGLVGCYHVRYYWFKKNETTNMSWF